MYLVFLMFILFIGTALAGDEAPKGKFSGYMFGDYYYVASNHNTQLEKLNGFWFRRVYFTYDRNLSDKFSIRLRFEMAHPGDFTTKDKMIPFVKDAYLKYKMGTHQIILGISPTPTWEVIEKIWGYRSVEKTPLDLQKFGSSRDLGIAIKGNLVETGKVKYHFMLANGNSNKSETNKGKKALLSVGFYPNKNIIIEIYGDYDDRPGSTDRITTQGFIAYKTKKFRVGLQYAHQIRKVQNASDLTLDIASVFAAGKIGQKTNLFVRVDKMLDPNPDGNKISYIPFDPTAKSTFIVGGVDITPLKTVHLMPNVEFVVYEKNNNGVKPDSDIIPRFTFYYKF
jgi:hypothetical protein